MDRSEAQLCVAGEGTVTIPGYAAFGSPVYLAGGKITVPGYSLDTSELYLAGSQKTIPGYTAFGSPVYLAGETITVPAYSQVSTNLYKAGVSVTQIGSKPNVTLYKRDSDYDSSFNTVGTAHSSGRYHEDSSTTVVTRGSSTSVTLRGSKIISTLYVANSSGTYKNVSTAPGTPYYQSGATNTYYSGGSSVYKEAAALQAIPYDGTLYEKGSSKTIPGYTAFGSDVYLAGGSVTAIGDKYSSTLYTRNSANDRSYTTIGSEPNVTLYKRDSDSDQTFTSIGSKVTSPLYWRDTDQDREYTTIGSEPNVTLYRRDIDLDREIPIAGTPCKVKLATISTQNVTVLTT